MRASMVASATAEPDTPPISVDSSTDTCAMPPTIRRVSRREKLIRCLVMPVWFIRLPAKIKNGTARKAIDCVCATTAAPPPQT